MIHNNGTEMTYQEFRFEIDSLEGNINRMCVTDNEKELSDMLDWAKLRINRIFEYRKNELTRREFPPNFV